MSPRPKLRLADKSGHSAKNEKIQQSLSSPPLPKKITPATFGEGVKIGSARVHATPEYMGQEETPAPASVRPENHSGALVLRR